MTASPFQQRACPCCGQSGGAPEIASDPRAEQLPPGALKDAWEGLNSDKPFFCYHRCRQCGLLFNPVYFSDDSLAALYGDLAPNMDMVPPDHIRRTQRGYFDQIADKALLTGGYLEIGPDVGYLVEEASRRGAFDHFWLYEPNMAVHGRLRRAAGDKPVTLTPAMFDLSAIPAGSVGLAVMIHVLDHLTDPLGMLRQIVDRLRPGGMLAIVTHNEASLLRRLIGRRWPPFCLQHPQLFSPQTIGAMLLRAGLETPLVRGSSNVFPSDFLVRQMMQAAGISPGRMALPSVSVRLRLGNILTLARAPLHAAAVMPDGTDVRA